MKKIFAGIVLPTLAAAAVIGSGFSIWFFGENQDSVSTTASIEVQNLLRIGDVTTSSDKADLHLDQTAKVREKIVANSTDYVTGDDVEFAEEKYNGYKTKDEVLAKGIYLTAQADATNAFDGYIKYTTPYNTPDNQYHDFIDGACKLQIVTTFKFEGGLKAFVGMKTTAPVGGTWDTPVDGTYTFTWTTELKQDKSYTAYLPMGKDSATATTGTNVTFAFEYLPFSNQYVDGKDGKRGGTEEDYVAGGVMATAEPHNDAEYSDMLAKIGTDSKLTITTVATIIEA